MPSTDAYQQLLEHINTSALDEEQCCICSLSSLYHLSLVICTVCLCNLQGVVRGEIGETA